MRIESAQVATKAHHAAVQQSLRQESLEFWVGKHRPSAERPAAPAADKFSLTPKAQASQPVPRVVSADEVDQSLSPRDRLLADILRHMLKLLSGEEPKLFSPSELADQMAGAQQNASEAGAKIQQAHQEQAAAAQNPPSVGFGLVYDSYESHYESESTSFSAEGTIKTKDGKEIQFSVQLNMSREFYTEHRESLRTGDAKKIDPLVVNFDGNAAQLGDSKFQFDLDSDGRTEQIALLKPGSGMLALDKNGDGSINNGSELFGTKTGNGFAELATYDEDKNGFIDEGDSIYNKLRIWTRDEQGNQQLAALGAKNIGAIYLGHLATPLTYKDSANATQGDVASTGLFVRENGSTGTVQQINYAV